MIATAAGRRLLKYRLLGLFPGNLGARYRLNRERVLRRYNANVLFRKALRESTGKVCVDLGANVGTYTKIMARRANWVYAFEPDPWTAERLRQTVGKLGNVDVFEAAAGTSDGTVELYRAPNFDDDPISMSQSSSIMKSKINVTHSKAFQVRMIDMVRFISELREPVHILKIDVEGAEVPILEALLDAPDVLDKLSYVFAETHETRIPDLADRTDALRQRCSAIKRPVINLDWV